MDISQIVEDKFKDVDTGSRKEISFKGEIGNLPFSAYLYIKPNTDKLFVMLNGAINQKREAGIPVYQRWSWHEEFPGSVLYITDPTLLKYTDIILAWYVGDKLNRVDIRLADFVTRVAAKLNVSKIVPYGSSGGGFAAIQLASNIGNGCIAVAINPQTIVFNYLEEAVDKYIHLCWHGFDKANLRNDLSFNAIENYQIKKPKILYVQNKVDIFHYDDHFIPFVNALGLDKDLIQQPLNEQSGAVKVLLYDHESGHAAEPKDLLQEIFSAIDDF
ncbi:hypothetical protein ACI2JM_01385 [Psychrobacter sp. NPDC064578]|uniref:hypothetical protein n=1 Tax=Psychrobacter sp. NPDC064578 TaxID=3364493 RepID=UPI003850E0AC